MLKHGSASTVTTADVQDSNKNGNIRRLRLTLHTQELPEENNEVQEKGSKGSDEMTAGSARRRKNGHMYIENATIVESPILHLSTAASRVPAEKSKRSVVYGVVRRPDTENQSEVLVYQWSVNQVKEDMEYIKEVRNSLEKVSERIYGEFGGMQQKLQQLSNEIRVANTQQQVWQHEAKVKSAALDSYSQMNSALSTVTLDLQKALVDSSLERSDMREEMKNLRESYQQAMEKMKEKEQQLVAAISENEILKLKVEASQEANAEALRDLTRNLHSEHEYKLREEQQRYQAELEALQAQVTSYVLQIEEANRKVKETEEKITERDQRIGELDKFISRMEKEREILQRSLEEKEYALVRIRLADEPDSLAHNKRSQQLEEEASSLRERIKHLDNMVHCQQRKVKQMIEEIERLRDKIMQKDLYIEHLLERICAVECENKELQDKLNYLLSRNNVPRSPAETREIGAGCDLTDSIQVQPQSQTEVPVQRKKTTISTPYMRLMELSDRRSKQNWVCFFVHSFVHFPVTPSVNIMATLWTERQGHLGELTKKSKEELLDILNRQEKLLTNKRFIQSLPDKGKKISDFAEKIKAALAYHEDMKNRTEMLSAVKVELHSKYPQKNTKPSVLDDSSIHQENGKPTALIGNCTVQPENSSTADKTMKEFDLTQQGHCSAPPSHSNNGVHSDSLSVCSLEEETNKQEEQLIKAFEKVTLANSTAVHVDEQDVKDYNEERWSDDHLKTDSNLKLHYVQVLEKAQQNAVKPKFRPNQLSQSQNCLSSASSSPSYSPQGPESQLSKEERRLEEKKHLDDITSAKLPPLHHMPAMLLTLEESAALQISQQKKYEELQVKLAARKLAQRMDFKMVRFVPEGSSERVYREVHDDGAYNSSEDD
ncbi:myocardial zonula adherens protein-like [Polypterus senegalus]|uniref:myocardial zonula adherens protein-like n=1 Tax=Polypterus senegalus TaxID=55291 RepID=UPI001966B45F|nr:myocardial zonula adherens protein-like [Polypterus senegalus]